MFVLVMAISWSEIQRKELVHWQMKKFVGACILPECGWPERSFVSSSQGLENVTKMIKDVLIYMTLPKLQCVLNFWMDVVLIPIASWLMRYLSGLISLTWICPQIWCFFMLPYDLTLGYLFSAGHTWEDARLFLFSARWALTAFWLPY